MVILGVILLILALLFSGAGSILFWIGVALIIAGLFLNFVPVGGTTRRYY